MRIRPSARRILNSVVPSRSCIKRATSADAAAAAFGVKHAYDDWRRMLADHQLDLVCIATPTVTHAEMALAALDAGANVLCEKPTSMDAGEAKAGGLPPGRGKWTRYRGTKMPPRPWSRPS